MSDRGTILAVLIGIFFGVAGPLTIAAIAIYFT
jgi:hypothetical protein